MWRAFVLIITNRMTQTGTTLNILGTAPDMLKIKIMNLDHFYLWKKNPVRARELLTWIQKAIPKRFPFLLKGEDGNVNVYPFNNFLASYGISSCHLRKIGSDHA